MTEKARSMAMLNDAEYFQGRAEAEIEAAQSARHAAAVRAHYELACHYLDLAHDPEARAASDGAGPDGSTIGSMSGLHIIGASPRA